MSSAAVLAKTVLLSLTDESSRRKIGWVLAAIFSPVILVVALLTLSSIGSCFLLLDIFPQCFLLDAYSAHIVPRRPEMPVPKLILQICVTLENHHRAFPLQIPYEA